MLPKFKFNLNNLCAPSFSRRILYATKYCERKNSLTIWFFKPPYTVDEKKVLKGGAVQKLNFEPNFCLFQSIFNVEISKEFLTLLKLLCSEV